MNGQSLIKISNGARARLSGIVAAVLLLVFIMFGASYIEKMPIAALTGLMIMLAIGTFEWASVRAIGKMPGLDTLVGILVAAITVLFHNLALAGRRHHFGPGVFLGKRKTLSGPQICG